MAEETKQFTVYWRDGKRSILEGNSIEEAFRKAGYGAGAMAAVDFYANGDCNDYVWNKDTHEWDRTTPIIDTYFDKGNAEEADRAQAQNESGD